ncbi:MAG: AI-2E family transporter [Bacteroides sp.]|nr:AI-2E family transporter [Bacteroides sp.]
MNNQATNTSIYDTMIRLFVVLLVIAWCMMIMYPFASIILWSLIIGLALLPLHKTLSEKIGGRPKLVSFVIVLAILAIFIVPMGIMINSLVDEVKELKVIYDQDGFNVPAPSEKVKEWPIIGESLYNSWESASQSLGQILVKYQEQLTEIGGKIAKGILGAAGDLIQILISVIIAGILLITRSTGESIRKFFRKIAGDRGDEFADLTLSTVGSVVKGILGVAFILAVLHGILFVLADIPYAGILTLLVFVLGIIQIPTLFVSIPVVIYLFSVKEPVPAVIWSVLILVAGMADNVLKPLLLGKGASVPMLVIFIGVIGGFMLSGFLGLFTGAIVMSIGYKLYIGWVNDGSKSSQDSIKTV